MTEKYWSRSVDGPTPARFHSAGPEGRGNRARAAGPAPCPYRQWCEPTSTPGNILRSPAADGEDAVGDNLAHNEKAPLEIVFAGQVGGVSNKDLPHHRLDRLHAFAKDGIVDGHVAPAEHAEALRRDDLLDDLVNLTARRGVARHEELADRIVTRLRQVDAELGAFGGEERMRDLGQHAAAVAETRICAHSAAMVEIAQDLQAFFENVVRLAVLHIGHKADTAGIVLLGRIVEGLGSRHQGVQTERGLQRLAVRLFERRLSCGVHLSAPRAVADFVRPSFRIFKAYRGQRRLRSAQLRGITRRIFFDPSLSFDPTTL